MAMKPVFIVGLDNIIYRVVADYHSATVTILKGIKAGQKAEWFIDECPIGDTPHRIVTVSGDRWTLTERAAELASRR